MTLSGMPSFRLYGLPIPHHDKNATRSSAPSSPSQSPSPLATPPASPSGDSTDAASFTHPTKPMPPPGPAHYETRRALWLMPPPHPPRPPSPSTSRARLESLLSQEGAIESDDVWNAGLRSVWKGLVGGGRLRRRLPLATVVRSHLNCCAGKESLIDMYTAQDPTGGLGA